MGREFIAGFSTLLGYFAVCASGALLLRHCVSLPREVFRKTLHMIALGSVFVFTFAFRTWWVSAMAAAAFGAVVFPLLALAERLPGYADMLTERKSGEIKRSLIVVSCMFTLLIIICWGRLGERYLVIASVLAWGLGDAAAALVGKRFGRHYIEGRWVEGRKSLEGTLAMFAVSFAAVMAVLLVWAPVYWHGYVPIAAATAGVAALVELYTRNGMDTITCPLAAAATLIPLVYLMGSVSP